MSTPPEQLVADCGRCSGLCCVALPLTRGADFPVDKPAGVPCTHLQPDDRCGIHERLREGGWVGCTVFDCFGAGQRVTQQTYAATSWRGETAEQAGERFAVLGVVRRLHELLVLLDEARTRAPYDVLRVRAEELFDRADRAAGGTPEQVLGVDVDGLFGTTGALLSEVSAALRPRPATILPRDLAGADLRGRDLRQSDLRGRLLLGADLREADLRGADLLGADLRGARIGAADLTGALFLTRPQVAAATADASTRLDRGRAGPS